jgi:hypothetical protein
VIRTLAVRLCRGLATLAIAATCGVSTAHAQAPQQGGAPPDTGFPVVPALLAVLATGLILFVICVPSGKEE